MFSFFLLFPLLSTNHRPFSIVLLNHAFPFHTLFLPSATLIPPFLQIFPCIWLLSSIIISAFRPFTTSLCHFFSFVHILFSISPFPLIFHHPLIHVPFFLHVPVLLSSPHTVPFHLPLLPPPLPPPEVASVRGPAGGLKVRGSSSSVQSLLQSYGSSLRKPRGLGRSLSSYLNHTTRLGTDVHNACTFCLCLYSRV